EQIMTQPVRFTPDIESPVDHEEELTRQILDGMAASQQEAAGKHRHAHRDAHAKSHAILKATLTAHDNLPAELAQGIFRQPKSYKAMVRLSSSPDDLPTNRTPPPRGCAIKILGVTADRLAPEIGGHNQHLLIVTFPTLAFGTTSKYKDILQ